MNAKRMVLAGGSGFLGRLLRDYFMTRDWEVTTLTRAPKPGALGREVFWDGRTLDSWSEELEGAAVLINLAGRSVDCRYHARNRRLILDSRVESTGILGKAVADCSAPPPVWLNSSTATIYRHTLGPAWDEGGEIGATAEAKDEFSIHVATEWERVFQEQSTPHTRKVTLRSAMVLGPDGNSVFPVLCRLVRFRLGGTMGSGHHYVSWIHSVDFCRAIAWLIEHPELTGPVNLAAPHPLPNREMMTTLRELCAVRLGLPAPAWLLELGAYLLRTETELIIKSRRVVPGKLMASGFSFNFPQIRRAFQDLIHAHRTSAGAA